MIVADEGLYYDVVADIGHGYGKFICGAKEFAFPAVVSSVKPDEANFSALGKKKALVLEVEGQSFAIGDDAIESRRNLQRRLDQSGLGEELHKIVMLAGFSQVVPGSGDIRLITQIPIDWYNQREKLLALAGKYTVSYSGKSYYYLLSPKNITVYPESFGTIVAHAINKNGELVEDFSGKKTIVIDCGTQTTNIGVFDGLRLVGSQSSTVATGMSDVYEYLQSAINTELGRKPAPEDIDKALREKDGIFTLGGKSLDLNKPAYLPLATKQVANTVITEIQNSLEGGTQGDYILGGGGGWPRIEEHIKRKFTDQVLDQQAFKSARNVAPWMLNATGLKRFELFKAARNGR